MTVDAAHEEPRLALRPRRSRYFVATEGQPRVRRAGDIVAVVLGLLLIGWAVLVNGVNDSIGAALSSFAATLPEWLVSLLGFIYSLGLVYGIIIVASLALGHRWSGLRDVLLASGLAFGMALAIVAYNDQLWPRLFPEFGSGDVDVQFPVVRVAGATALVLTASPFLARPVRRLGWAIVVLISLASFALGYGAPNGALGALGIGMACAGSVLLIVGSPKGYPEVEAVQEGLGQLGIDLADLRLDPDQSWGVRRLVGTDARGRTIEVKAYGRDATDSQLMSKAWRALTYRRGRSPFAFTRLQAVEHEALATLLAGRAGVKVPEVLVAAKATDEVAVLVLTQSGVPLRSITAVDVEDSALVDLWRDVARLHDAGITHGSLTGDNVRLGEEGCTIGDFSDSSVVFDEASAQLDVVDLLFATAVVVGPERAAAAAEQGIGRERLTDAMPYLQVPAISSQNKKHAEKAKLVVKALSDEVAQVTGIDPAPSVKLRRVGTRDLLTVFILVMFLTAIVPLLAGADWSEIWDSLRDATWWLVAIALVLGQAVFASQATAMLFTVGRALPFKPLTVLQNAMTYISFAIPGAAGRVTMEAAFLYKYGVSPTASVTKGALDSLSGFLVQCVILGAALLTGSVHLTSSSSSSTSDTSSDSSTTNWWLVAGIVVGLAVITVLVVWKVQRLHDRVAPVIGSAWEALREVLRAPKRAFGLLGSQIMTQLLLGLILWIALVSVDYRLDLVACLVVVVATSLLQGILPVPGGIGVSEAVMAGFLVGFDVPSGTALAATIIWRVSTFYLPAPEGFFAMNWLTKNGYL